MILISCSLPSWWRKSSNLCNSEKTNVENGSENKTNRKRNDMTYVIKRYNKFTEAEQNLEGVLGEDD